jgi:iron complex outermembrane recepter protein
MSVGFNARPTASGSEVTALDPETARCYEIGSKTSWFERRLTLNVAGYWTQYKNIQLTVNQTPQNFVANAAEAKIRGFEIEAVARPVRWLDLNAGLGYTDAEYTKVGSGNPLQVLPITVNSKLVKTPKWSFNAGGQVTQELGTAGDLVWRVDASYSSEYFNDVGNAPLVAEDGYTLVNARVTFNTANRRWKVSAFVTNLTDARYYISGNTSPSFGLAEVAFGRPREWGLTLGYNF